jgi:predicted O-methyltransferase YrrM
VRLIDVPTSWQGIAIILADILERFRVERGACLEFGVQNGYSTAALSNFFEHVIGVDHFAGDLYLPIPDPIEQEAQTRTNLSTFPNIEIVTETYQAFTAKNDGQYDFCHIDIAHTYEDTLACGRWAIHHAPVVIFHDTRSYPDVLRAMTTISNETGVWCYDWPEPDGCNGLGILSRGKICG